MQQDSSLPDADDASWTFLSNHSHVLICLARDSGLRLRELAALVGMTDRGVSKVINELESAGYLERERVGRRNRYRVCSNLPMRHPVERGHRIDDLLAVMTPEGDFFPD